MDEDEATEVRPRSAEATEVRPRSAVDWKARQHQVLRLRVRPRPDATERKPLRGGGAPAVDGSIDEIQQASGHIEGVPGSATSNLPVSPKLPVASNDDSGPLRSETMNSHFSQIGEGRKTGPRNQTTTNGRGATEVIKDVLR